MGRGEGAITSSGRLPMFKMILRVEGDYEVSIVLPG